MILSPSVYSLSMPMMREKIETFLVLASAMRAFSASSAYSPRWSSLSRLKGLHHPHFRAIQEPRQYAATERTIEIP